MFVIFIKLKLANTLVSKYDFNTTNNNNGLDSYTRNNLNLTD